MSFFDQYLPNDDRIHTDIHTHKFTRNSRARLRKEVDLKSVILTVYINVNYNVGLGGG